MARNGQLFSRLMLLFRTTLQYSFGYLSILTIRRFILTPRPQTGMPSPRFEEAYQNANGYTLSTPYGIVRVSGDGRKVTFELYGDVRESIHNKALFSYYRKIVDLGATSINVDHLDLPGLDRSLNLKRGRHRLDMVYTLRGKLYEVELETHRQVGLNQTAEQLKEFAKLCENPFLVIPRRDMEDAMYILEALHIKDKIKLDFYDLREDEGESDDGNE
jgi:hypothetical protein